MLGEVCSKIYMPKYNSVGIPVIPVSLAIEARKQLHLPVLAPHSGLLVGNRPMLGLWLLVLHKKSQLNSTMKIKLTKKSKGSDKINSTLRYQDQF